MKPPENCDKGSSQLPRVQMMSSDCTRLSDLLGGGDYEPCCPFVSPLSCYHGNAAHPDITPGGLVTKFLDLELVSIL